MLTYFFYTILIIFLGYVNLLFNKKNFLFFLIYLEIIYNGIILNFICVGSSSHELSSIIYFFVSIVLIAAESVVGLVLSVLYQRAGNGIELENLSVLKG